MNLQYELRFDNHTMCKKLIGVKVNSSQNLKVNSKQNLKVNSTPNCQCNNIVCYDCGLFPKKPPIPKGNQINVDLSNADGELGPTQTDYTNQYSFKEVKKLKNFINWTNCGFTEEFRLWYNCTYPNDPHWPPSDPGDDPGQLFPESLVKTDSEGVLTVPYDFIFKVVEYISNCEPCSKKICPDSYSMLCPRLFQLELGKVDKYHPVTYYTLSLTCWTYGTDSWRNRYEVPGPHIYEGSTVFRSYKYVYYSFANKKYVTSQTKCTCTPPKPENNKDK